MKQTKQVTTVTVEMTGDEYETLRLLSERIRNDEQYVAGENWRYHLAHIVGEDGVDVIANLVKEE